MSEEVVTTTDESKSEKNAMLAMAMARIGETAASLSRKVPVHANTIRSLLNDRTRRPMRSVSYLLTIALNVSSLEEIGLGKKE